MRTERETAKAITDLLDESVEKLQPEILDGLSMARNRAAAAMVERKHAGAGADGYSIGGVLRMFSDFMHQHRVIMPAAMVCSAALVAFVLTQHMNQSRLEQGDAFLLASELPPEAFLDKGFDTWVARSSRR
ncbi:hypothetical protein MTYP_01971 [Methylophilaceae bacterium]|nr:hypothetical protein MTYP_01971 [Methylophilaceae bacterium]